MYAYIDEDDRDHEASLELLELHLGPLLVPQLVVTDVAYLVEKRLGWTAEVELVARYRFELLP